jgi:hypothetical protein
MLNFRLFTTYANSVKWDSEFCQAALGCILRLLQVRPGIVTVNLVFQMILLLVLGKGYSLVIRGQ